MIEQHFIDAVHIVGLYRPGVRQAGRRRWEAAVARSVTSVAATPATAPRSTWFNGAL